MNKQIRNDLEAARRARRIRQDETERGGRRRAYAVIFTVAFVLGAALAYTVMHGPVVH